MDIYEKKYIGKIVLLIAALVIIAASLLYSNILATKLANEERKRIQLFANATQKLSSMPIDSSLVIDYTFFLTGVIQDNNNIPVIITDNKGSILTYRNLNDEKIHSQPAYLYNKLTEMKAAYEPIVIDLSLYPSITANGDTLNNAENIDAKQYFYYFDSNLLSQLKQLPYIQIAIITLFLLVAYSTFSTARRAEQNKVWLGMAKETAHQLGTPLTSLVGWTELLKQSEEQDSFAATAGQEMDKDINRLKLIAERFSKIGSQPKLEVGNLKTEVEETFNYMKRLAPKKVQFSFQAEPNIPVLLNKVLFDWVIENLLKNALDAMEATGEIKIVIKTEGNKAIIDVSDTGKGIPKSKFNTIFAPGFSTKQRGWGLGLSLSKRIVENYHKGKIMVHSSTIGKGTTFRIILNKA